MKLYLSIILGVCLLFLSLWGVNHWSFYSKRWEGFKSPYDTKTAFIVSSLAQDVEGNLLELGVNRTSIPYRAVNSVNQWATEKAIAAIPESDGERELWRAWSAINPYRNIMTYAHKAHTKMPEDVLKEFVNEAASIAITLPRAAKINNPIMDTEERYTSVLSAYALLVQVNVLESQILEKPTLAELLASANKGIKAIKAHGYKDNKMLSQLYPSYVVFSTLIGATLIGKTNDNPLECSSAPVLDYVAVRHELDEYLAQNRDSAKLTTKAINTVEKVYSDESVMALDKRVAEACK
jgi:hypothetical protein